MQWKVGCVGKISSGIAEGFSEMEQEKGGGRGLYMYLKCEARKKKEIRK